MTRLRKFLTSDRGATAIEYALIAAAMGLTLATAMPFLATSTTSSFSSIAGHISTGQ